MNKAWTILTALTVSLVFAVAPVFAAEAPVITLERVEVASIQPFFVKPQVGFKSAEDPGKPENVGAIMNLAYIFNIKNPAKEPVMLDEFVFTTVFEGIEVNTAMVYEDAWIPAGKTNQLRVLVTNETLPTLLNLSVGSDAAQVLQKKGVKPAEMVKKWWDTIGDFAFPIEITNGAGLFKDEKGKEFRVTFTGKYEKK
jgi:hypothetical protein